MAVPNLWRTKHERYSLQGLVCPECSQAVFPPRLICPHCHQPMGTTVTKKGKERNLLHHAAGRRARAKSSGR